MPTYYQKVNSEWKKMTLRGITGKDVKVFVLDSGNNNAPDVSVNFTTDPQPDVNGHGSLMGSIVKSSIGLANGCILYNVKVVTDAGIATAANLANGLQYALDNGADVVSMSLQIGGFDSTVQSKINACAAAGIILMASSGNSTTLSDILYPGGALNVIATNAVKEDGTIIYKNALVGTLNHGIDICANGFGSECLDKNGNLTSQNGTSLCTSWLAAAFAAVKESLGYPTNKEVMNYILNRALKQPNAQLYGRGIFRF